MKPKTLSSKRGTKLRTMNISKKLCECPTCGTICKRHSTTTRHLHEIGISSPTVLVIIHSKHYCPNCRKHFNLPHSHIAPPSHHYTSRVLRTALDLRTSKHLTVEGISTYMKDHYHVTIPPTTIFEWFYKHT